jgi:altronate dehydratase
VRKALLLEHGCEKTHNDLMRRELAANGVDPEQFGYASIQLDGGIEKVSARVEQWFRQALGSTRQLQRQAVALAQLSLSVLSCGAVPDAVAMALARIAATIAGNGGTVVIPANATLLQSAPFLDILGWDPAPAPSLDYGQFARLAGMHVMATPTRHMVETLTGLGGTGAQLMLAHVAQTPLQGHPMIPLVQLASRGSAAAPFAADIDMLLEPETDDAQTLMDAIVKTVCAAASAEYQPHAGAAGNLDFQLTRGLLGVSL